MQLVIMRALGTALWRLPTSELQAVGRKTEEVWQLPGTTHTHIPRDSSKIGSPSNAGAVAGRTETVYRRGKLKERSTMVVERKKEERENREVVGGKK